MLEICDFLPRLSGDLVSKGLLPFISTQLTTPGAHGQDQFSKEATFQRFYMSTLNFCPNALTNSSEYVRKGNLGVLADPQNSARMIWN
jgi:hypothetical protein